MENVDVVGWGWKSWREWMSAVTLNVGKMGIEELEDG